MSAGRDMSVSVRPAEQRDYHRLMELLDQLGYEMPVEEFDRRMSGIADRTDHLLAVAENASGTVVGMLHAYERPSIEKPPEVTIQAMVVDSACRSAGIGGALMKAVEVWAGERGYDTIGLHTQTKRERAQAFYQRHGFEEAARSILYRRRLAR